MAWKDLKLGGKILVGVGSVLFMLLMVAVWAIFGISGIVKQNVGNAGVTEEIASTAEELSSQAELLQGSMDFFKVEDQGGNTPRLLLQAKRIAGRSA